MGYFLDYEQKLKFTEELLANYQEALKSRCICRFYEGELVEECHYHKCQRCVRLENGDPSTMSWEQQAGMATDLAEALGDELSLHRQKARDEYWAWQGDVEDHLDSLTVPVLIPAAALQSILKERDQLHEINLRLQDGLAEHDQLRRLVSSLRFEIDKGTRTKT